MSWYESAFSGCYPLLYAHRDEEEASRTVATLAHLAPLGDGPLLDLGCGEGRHLAPLVATGAGVIGVDLSAVLLATAAARRGWEPTLAGGVALVRADMCALPLNAGVVTAVLSLFTTFGYFGVLAAHGSLLDEIARVLREGGHWFLDYLNCERVREELADGPRTTTRRAAGVEIEETRRLERGGRLVIKRVTVRPSAGGEVGSSTVAAASPEGSYCEEVALFTPEELDSLAAASGLVRVAAAGGYDGRAWDRALAERWILIYRRLGTAVRTGLGRLGGVS